jgi:hypothetical protein
MLDEDTIADLDGDARLLRRTSGLDDAAVPSPIALALALTGHPPLLCTALRQEACLARIGNSWRVVVRRSVPAARKTWLVGHECAELHLKACGYAGEDIEARADALGAALVLPRATLCALTRAHGHRVHTIAKLTRLTQSLVLLRIGEVERRPVALMRRGIATVRGEPFGWPRKLSMAVAGTHPLRITDEPSRFGLMATAP